MTTPVVTHHYHAALGYPPPHPSPQDEQHVFISYADILSYLVYPLAIQILSLIASTAPKAQHEPQLA